MAHGGGAWCTGCCTGSRNFVHLFASFDVCLWSTSAHQHIGTSAHQHQHQHQHYHQPASALALRGSEPRLFVTRHSRYRPECMRPRARTAQGQRARRATSMKWSSEPDAKYFPSWLKAMVRTGQLHQKQARSTPQLSFQFNRGRWGKLLGPTRLWVSNHAQRTNPVVAGGTHSSRLIVRTHTIDFASQMLTSASALPTAK